MKKAVLLLAVLCLLLAGCNEQSDNLSGSTTGNFYNEFISDGSQPGSYTVTAEAHVDDVLSLLYFNTDIAQEVDFNLEVTDCQGAVQLVYVYINTRGFHEVVIWESNGKRGTTGAVYDGLLSLSSNETHLEWRSENGAVLQFKLTLSGFVDTDISMSNFEELPEIEELPENKPEDKPQDNSQTGNQIKM